MLLLLAGTIGGPVLGGAITWWLLAPIASVYRRAALSLVSGFAAFVAMFAGMPVHQAFGRAGLAGYALLFAAAGAAFFGQARAAARAR
ncbi:MAG TPA: hypothetical protein VFU46_08650 [Gemmatimonadales bacterium]|nr:hypothetical protein [Gemmatimonadales bacterium]